MRGRLSGIGFTVVLLVCAHASAQQRTELMKAQIDPVLEAQFRADVEHASAEAAAAFDRGNAARNDGDAAKAATEYRKAIELAPKVDHPHRRLCTALDTQMMFDEAVTECETAMSLSPQSAYDKSALAAALVARKRPADAERALQLAEEAASALPDDMSSLASWCMAAAVASNPLAMRRCADRMMVVEPDGVPANFFGALISASDRDYEEAHLRLLKAKNAGLDDATYQRLRQAFLDAEDKDKGSDLSIDWDAALYIGGTIVGIWIALMALLLIAGFALSRMTLREVNRATTSSADAIGTEREQRLRKVYKAVLLLSGVYFYLSLPLLLVTVVVAGCGAVAFFVAMGTIPIQLVLIIGIVMLGTIGAIFKSFLVRAPVPNLGTRIDLGANPKLQALLDDVARTIGTRRVDAAYLTPGTDMAVTERAGIWASLRGKRTERSLIMGVGLFDEMTQVQLRAVLGHEFGHFRNADTAGGGFAIAVRRSLYTLIIQLAKSGAARISNPVWWFVRGFHRMYLGISQGASRLQEVLADRWAIKAYGSEAFIAGYRHVVTRDVTFTEELDATLKDVIKRRTALPNLYTYEAASPTTSPTDLAEKIRKEMTREPTIYDSHPTTQQRIDWAQKLAVVHEPSPADNEPVWALFADREEVEHEMTDVIRTRVRAQHGLTIAATPKVAPPDADEGDDDGGDEADDDAS